MNPPIKSIEDTLITSIDDHLTEVTDKNFQFECTVTINSSGPMVLHDWLEFEEGNNTFYQKLNTFLQT